MTKHTQVVLYKPAAIGTSDPAQLKAEGQGMAQADPVGVFDTIEDTHSAEVATHAALVKQLDSRGAALLAHWTAVQGSLKAMGFDVAEHLHQLAAGRLDFSL